MSAEEDWNDPAKVPSIPVRVSIINERPIEGTVGEVVVGKWATTIIIRSWERASDQILQYTLSGSDLDMQLTREDCSRSDLKWLENIGARNQ